MRSDNRQMRLEYQNSPPIIFELKEIPEHIQKVKHHCTVYPCMKQSTHYFISTFGDVCKTITGVCDVHAHMLDEFLIPVKLHQN